jgi:hypothetical protein
MEVHEHREPAAAGRRRRWPVHADAEAARRVVEDVLPLHAGDVRQRVLWPEHGFVAADDGAVAEELEDARQPLHDVRHRVTCHLGVMDRC